MVTLKLCNPEAHVQFDSFRHHTTTYVSVPHGCLNRLWVGAKRTSYLEVTAEGQLVIAKQINPPGDHVMISDYHQPTSKPGNFQQLLRNFRGNRRNLPTTPPPPRLYRFEATVLDAPREHGGEVLASEEFHILCPTEHGWAEALHLELMENPKAIAPFRISDKTEGQVCPLCVEIRRRLISRWQEDQD